MDGISSYIANMSMNMSQVKVQTTVQTALLKQSMELPEQQAANLMSAIEDRSVPNFGGSIDLHI